MRVVGGAGGETGVLEVESGIRTTATGPTSSTVGSRRTTGERTSS